MADDPKPIPTRTRTFDLVPLRSTADAGQDLDLLASEFGASDDDEAPAPSRAKAGKTLDELADEFGAYEPPTERRLDERGKVREVDPFGNMVPRAFRSGAPQGPSQKTPGRWSQPKTIDVARVPQPAFEDTLEGMSRSDIPPAVGDRITDTLVTGVRAAVGLPKAAVGLVDIPAGGRVGKALEDNVGYRPGEALNILDDWYSDRLKRQKLDVEEADGILATAVAALNNPEVVFHTVLESLPLIGAGGLAGRAIPGGASLVTRGAIGEGVVSAGAAASDIREQNPDRLLSRSQGALAVATGAGTTVLGRLGGALAKKAGLDDIDTLFAAAEFDPIVKRNIVQAVLRGLAGAGQEGLLEELPQSVYEQAMQNLATGQPIEKGVDKAAVMGALSGGVMGFGANLLPIRKEDDGAMQDEALAPEPDWSVFGRLSPDGGAPMDAAPADQPPPPVPPTEPPDAPLAVGNEPRYFQIDNAIMEDGPITVQVLYRDGRPAAIYDRGSMIDIADGLSSLPPEQIVARLIGDHPEGADPFYDKVRPIEPPPKPDRGGSTAPPPASLADLGDETAPPAPPAPDVEALLAEADQLDAESDAKAAARKARADYIEGVTAPKDEADARRVLPFEPAALEDGDGYGYAPGQLEVVRPGTHVEDLEQWKAGVRAMGYSDAEIENAITDAERRWVDPTRSDDLHDLMNYLDGLDADRKDAGLAPLPPLFEDPDAPEPSIEELDDAATTEAPLVEPYEQDVVHVTTPENERGIRAQGFDVNRREGGIGADDYGPGLYLADRASDMAGYWASELANKNDSGRVETSAMRGTVRLTRPFVADTLDDRGKALDERTIVRKTDPALLARYDELIGRGVRPRKALGHAVREGGYDGLVLRRRAGEEIVAFDASAVEFQPPRVSATSIEVVDDAATTENASGESAASAEALSRQEGMKARGERFVVYNKAGKPRDLIGPEAVDYTPKNGETYGVQGPDGFRVLTDNGGKVPARPAFEAPPDRTPSNRELLDDAAARIKNGAAVSPEDAQMLRDLAQEEADANRGAIDVESKPRTASDLKVGDRFFTLKDGYVTVERVLPVDPKYPRDRQVDTDRGRRLFDADLILQIERPAIDTTANPSKDDVAAMSDEELAAEIKRRLEAENTANDLKRMAVEDILPAPEKTVSAKALAGDERLSQDAADARIAAWKAEAKRIGKDEDHSNEVVFSLFDRTGGWAQPWIDAGYDVRTYDIATGDDLQEFFPMADIVEAVEAGKQIIGVLAAPPCTSFAVSGARWWEDQHDKADVQMVEKKYGWRASRYFDTPLDYANTLVAITQAFIEFANPSRFHAVENPVGRIASQNDLPKPLLSFDPSNFGNPYTKKTFLWGSFNPNLPTANVDPSLGSYISVLRGDDPAQKAERSTTPEGFAYAFFMANHPDTATKRAAAPAPVAKPKQGKRPPFEKKKTPLDEAMERIAAEDEAERAKAPEGWTTEAPKDRSAGGGLSIFSTPKPKVGKGGWVIMGRTSMGWGPTSSWSANKVKADGAKQLDALKAATDARPMRIETPDGQLVYETPAWKTRRSGSVGATPTPRGYVASYTDGEGVEYYSEEAFPKADGAFAAARKLATDLKGPLMHRYSGKPVLYGTDDWNDAAQIDKPAKAAPEEEAPTRSEEWAPQTIQVTVQSPLKGDPARSVDVEARVRRGLAVHKRVAPTSDRENPNRWHVTPVTAGIALMTGFQSEADAIAAADEVLALGDTDWTQDKAALAKLGPTDLGAQIKAIHKTFIDQYASESETRDKPKPAKAKTGKRPPFEKTPPGGWTAADKVVPERAPVAAEDEADTPDILRPWIGGLGRNNVDPAEWSRMPVQALRALIARTQARADRATTSQYDRENALNYIERVKEAMEGRDEFNAGDYVYIKNQRMNLGQFTVEGYEGRFVNLVSADRTDRRQVSVSEIEPAGQPAAASSKPKRTMAEARRDAALDQTMSFDGTVMTRRAAVDARVAAGATVQTVNGERRLTKPDGSYLSEKQIGKTAMDYADEKVAAPKKPVTPQVPALGGMTPLGGAAATEALESTTDLDRSAEDIIKSARLAARDGRLTNDELSEITEAIDFARQKITATRMDGADVKRIGQMLTEAAKTLSAHLRANFDKTFETKPLFVTTPAADAKAAKLEALRAKSKAARDEIEAAKAGLKAALKKAGPTLNSGLPLPPDDVLLQTVKLVRAYAKAGIVEAAEGWLLFQDDMGALAAQAKRAFQMAWGMVHKVAEPALEDSDGESATVGTGRSDTGDGPVAGEQTADSGSDAADDVRDGRDGGLEGERSGRDGGDVEGGRAGADGPQPDVAGANAGGQRGGRRSGGRRGGRADGRNPVPQPHSDDTGAVDRLDYVIGAAGELTSGGAKTKLADNMAAIRLLLDLRKTGRRATGAEQQVLARYVGWGATELSKVVDRRNNEQLDDATLAKARLELTDLLTEDEFQSLSRSITNAHYTFFETPTVMWEAVRRMGFTGGRVLEPAVGSGHFFGTMPADLRDASHRTGVELDTLSAELTSHLYQGAQIINAGFQDAPLADNSFDLAISNVPFGDYGVTDPLYQGRRKYLADSIHNYFFVKALDKVRPGGFVAFVTSRQTMDAPTHKPVRQYLVGRANFLGAVRLPDRSFKATAGTEVVTDIIFLQKRSDDAMPTPEQAALNAMFVASERVEVGNRSFKRNTYYDEYPRNILGVERDNGKMNRHGNDYNVQVDENRADIAAAMTEALAASLPRDIFTRGAQTGNTEDAVIVRSDAKHGEFVEQDGTLYRNQFGILEKLDVTAKAAARIRGFIAIKKAYGALLATNLDQDMSDADRAPKLTEGQAALTAAYESFVKEYGSVNTVYNRSQFKGDPESSRVFALENIRWVTEPQGNGKKAKRVLRVVGRSDIFEKRVAQQPVEPTSAASAKDALVQALAWRGRVDLDYMAALLGDTPEGVIDALDERDIFFDPTLQRWVTNDEYLSGDVVSKLAAATAAGLDGHITALEAVQPPKLTTNQVDARMGAIFVKPSWIKAFLGSVIGESAESMDISLDEGAERIHWRVEGGSRALTEANKRHELYVNGYGGPIEMAADIMGLGLPTVYTGDRDERVLDPVNTTKARENMRRLEEMWREWWPLQEGISKEVVDDYNARFNRLTERKFDGDHLELPGSNPIVKLRRWQKAVVWRILQKGNTLMAHVVGAGKTYAMIAAAMELRRLGLANKPMIGIPNHMIGQFTRDFYRLYPGAKLLVTSKDDLKKENRNTFMARISGGDWDTVIVTHDQFKKIGVHPDTFKAFVDEQIADLERMYEAAHEAGDERTAKQYEKAIERLRVKLANRTKAWEKDKAVTFEELGVDALFVDEAHLFKNLFFATSMTRVAGLNRSESDRAVDMFLKVRWLSRKTNGRNIVFATGTPIANAVSELFTMMRYLAMDSLEGLGLDAFDAWVQQFADRVAKDEPAPEGGYREKIRLRKYTNAPELIKLFRNFADVVMPEDIPDLRRPKIVGGAPEIVVNDASRLMARLKRAWAKRVAAIRSGDVEPTVDNMLKVTSEAAAAAVDIRLVVPTAPEEADSRLNRAAANIVRVHKQWAADKGTQIVFLDIGTPKNPPPLAFMADIDLSDQEATTKEDDAEPEKKDGDEADTDDVIPTFDGRDLYADLKAKLVKAGIPANEIAFVHSAKTDAQKQLLFEAVNDGRIRVLMGSTGKMGVGTNVQERLVALHHVDVPWRPADLEQREGRILRQGNKLHDRDGDAFEVGIFRYVTKNSFDEYRWGLLAIKQGFISQLIRGKSGVRTFEDTDPAQLDFEEASAAAGDPRQLDLRNLLTALDKLRLRESGHEDKRREARRLIPTTETNIEESSARAARLTTLRDALDAWWKDPERTVTFDDASYRTAPGQDDRKVLAEALKTFAAGKFTDMKNGASNGWDVVGTIGPLELRAHWDQHVIRGGINGKGRYGRVHRSVKFSIAEPGGRWTHHSIDTSAAWLYEASLDFETREETDPRPDLMAPAFLSSLEAISRISAVQAFIDSSNRYADEQRKALKDYVALEARPFPDAGRIDKLVAEVAELTAAINADAAAVVAPTGDDGGATDSGLPPGVDISHIETPTARPKAPTASATLNPDKWVKTAYKASISGGQVEVKGDVRQQFGLRKVNGEWQVDHLPTGYRLTKFGLKERAKLFADQLIASGHDWSFTTEEGFTDKHRATASAVERAVVRGVTGPSGDASAGDFIETETSSAVAIGGQQSLMAPAQAQAMVTTARTVQVPELVAFAQELAANLRVVRKFRSLETKGGFRAGLIALRADMFKPENRAQLAKLLAHEIGHLVDWLPDMDLRRGNILGRVQSLHRFMKHKYTASDGTTVKLAPMRAELKALSAAWRPWPDAYPDSYKAYRDRGRELYADAISAVLNDPAFAQQHAPTFFKEFFAELDEKPEVKQAYFELMDILSGTQEELIERRRGRVRAAYDYGNTRALDLVALKLAERDAMRYSVMDRIRIQHVDRNTALNDRVADWEKEHGQKVPSHEDPRFLLEEQAHIKGGAKGFAAKFFEPVYRALNKAGVDWTTFGEILFYERIVAGDRDKVANPQGLSAENAQEMLDAAFASLSAAQRTVAREQADAFREALREVAERAYQAGLYTDEMYAQMQKNPAYVTFRVLEYLDQNVTSTVYRQVGTLKDIQHPAEASIVKAMVTLKAAEYNRIKRGTFEWFDANTPGEFVAAPTKWMGKSRGWVPQEPKDNKLKLITYKVKGKLVGKHVDPYVAASFERMGADELGVILGTLNLLTSKWLRPVFTTMNPGFMTFNLKRDFDRGWKNMDAALVAQGKPRMTLRRWLKRYYQAVPMSVARAFPSKPGQTVAAWRQRAEQALIDAEEAKILDLTLADILGADNLEDTNIDQVFADIGLSSYAAQKGRLRRFLGWVEAAGDFIETLPKAAAIIELTSDGRTVKELTADERSLIRRKIGSPDYLQRGTKTAASNTIFLFSNAIIQGTRADVEVATDPTTRAGWWFKTAAVNLAPKVMMFALPMAAAALAGGGGGDDEDDWLSFTARVMSGVSEYDKTNYVIVPLGLDENGDSIYARLPQDDTGRLVGGIFWKGLGMMAGDKDAMKSLMQAFDFTAGQLPGANPLVRAITSDLPAMAAGLNVYDPFRSRMLFTPDELAAMDRHTFKKFVGYEFQQLGGGIIWRFVPGEERPVTKSTERMLLDLPIVSNVIGRWIRVGNRGRVEGLREITSDVRQDEARARLNEKEQVNEAIRALQAVPPPNRARVTTERASAIIKDVYPTLKGGDADDKRKLVEKKVRLGLVRGAADEYVETIMSSTSNAQKVAVVQRAKREMTPPRFSAWLRRGQDEGVISKAVAEAARKER